MPQTSNRLSPLKLSVYRKLVVGLCAYIFISLIGVLAYYPELKQAGINIWFFLISWVFAFVALVNVSATVGENNPLNCTKHGCEALNDLMEKSTNVTRYVRSIVDNGLELVCLDLSNAEKIYKQDQLTDLITKLPNAKLDPTYKKKRTQNYILVLLVFAVVPFTILSNSYVISQLATIAPNLHAFLITLESILLCVSILGIDSHFRRNQFLEESTLVPRCLELLNDPQCSPRFNEYASKKRFLSGDLLDIISKHEKFINDLNCKKVHNIL